MARYYNATGGVVNVTLRSGAVTSVRARSWITVPAHLDGSGDLHAKVRKGLLRRLSDPAETPSTSKLMDVDVVQVPEVVRESVIPTVAFSSEVESTTDSETPSPMDASDMPSEASEAEPTESVEAVASVDVGAEGAPEASNPSRRGKHRRRN